MVIIFPGDRRLQQLDQEAGRIIRDGYRPGSLKNLRAQAAAYYSFCDCFQLNYFPADSTQLLRFATYLYKEKRLAPATIINYISGVRTLHGLLQITQPDSSSYVVQALFRGLKARHNKPRKQAIAIDPSMFRQIFKQVNIDEPLELVAWVAALMGFHLLLRASNITAVSRTRFDPEINLCRRDFRIHQGLILVHIRWSKTLQYKERQLLIPVIPFTEPDISAERWFLYMISKIPAPPHAPAFCVPVKKNKQTQFMPLSYSQLSRLLKKWAEAANLPSDRFTSHCLRRGGASWLIENGVPDSVVKVLGDWRSCAFQNYIDSALKTRLEAMEMFVSKN